MSLWKRFKQAAVDWLDFQPKPTSLTETLNESLLRSGWKKVTYPAWPADFDAQIDEWFGLTASEQEALLAPPLKAPTKPPKPATRKQKLPTKEEYSCIPYPKCSYDELIRAAKEGYEEFYPESLFRDVILDISAKAPRKPRKPKATKKAIPVAKKTKKARTARPVKAERPLKTAQTRKAENGAVKRKKP